MEVDLGKARRCRMNGRSSVTGVENDRFDIPCEGDAPVDVRLDIAIQWFEVFGQHPLDERRQLIHAHDPVRLEHRIGVTECCSLRRLGPEAKERGAESRRGAVRLSEVERAVDRAGVSGPAVARRDER